MKRMVTQGLVAAAMALSALSGAAWAGGGDDFGCSNATLKGDIRVWRHGIHPARGRAGRLGWSPASRYFDGNGGLTQRDYTGRSSPAEFAPPGQETRHLYRQQRLHRQHGDRPERAHVPAGSSGVIKVLFVISDGGRHIHEVVSEFTPPGSSVPAAPKPAPMTGRSHRKAKNSHSRPSDGLAAADQREAIASAADWPAGYSRG